jgi:perosamine synthetase
MLPVEEFWAKSVYWVYGIVLRDDFPLNAKEIMRRMSQNGIGTRPFFWPMHEQPVFQKMDMFMGESYPVAERIARRGFYIPSGLGLTEKSMDTVVRCLCEVVK